MAVARAASPGTLPERGGQRGFTLIELLLVLVIAALASGLVALALRDSNADRLEREAVRLAALLDTARAASRASGVPVAFALAGTGDGSVGDFRFAGLPPGLRLPSQWLNPETQATIGSTAATAIVLGPEPLIGAQRVELRLGEQRIALVSDGLGPFIVDRAGAL